MTTPDRETWNVTCDSTEDGHGFDHGSLEAARDCTFRAAVLAAHDNHDERPDTSECPICIRGFELAAKWWDTNAGLSVALDEFKEGKI